MERTGYPETSGNQVLPHAAYPPRREKTSTTPRPQPGISFLFTMVYHNRKDLQVQKFVLVSYYTDL